MIGLVGAAALVTACGATPRAAGPTGTSGAATTQPTTSPTTSPSPTTAPSPSGGTGSGAPVVPTSGAYLGAWLHPTAAVAGSPSFVVEQQALPAVRAATGHPLGILHLYVGWRQPAPVADLAAVAAAGSVPLLDWGCAPDGPQVAGGADDALITRFATSLRTYGGPVLLRWCWEMNLVGSHPGVGGPVGFTTAWSHIRALFTSAGADNVSFVWCPALSGADPTPYFPGASEVDWIGIDGYDRSGTETFGSLFTSFYRQWVGQGKPLLVAETGSSGSSQPAFIASIGTDLPALPEIKGVVYFDAPGPAAPWEFTPAGLAAFAALAREPYFQPS